MNCVGFGKARLYITLLIFGKEEGEIIAANQTHWFNSESVI